MDLMRLTAEWFFKNSVFFFFFWICWWPVNSQLQMFSLCCLLSLVFTNHPALPPLNSHPARQILVKISHFGIIRVPSSADLIKNLETGILVFMGNGFVSNLSLAMVGDILSESISTAPF